MRIAILLAGTNEPSNCVVMAEAFAAGIRRHTPDAVITTLRLKDMDIPHFTLEYYHPEVMHNDALTQLRQVVEASDGIVVATPIWNFSVPAHLKNTIDHLGAFALDAETHSKGQLKNRPCYFLFTGGAPVIAWKALMNITSLHVSEAFKYYGGAIVGRHFEPKCLPGRGKFGLVLDKRADLPERLGAKGATYAKVVQNHQATGNLPGFLQLRRSVATWAYRIGNRIMYPVSSAQ